MAAPAAGSSIRPVPVAVPFGLRAAATPSHQITAARFPKYSPDSNLRSVSVRATSSAETCVSDPPSQLQPAQPAKPEPEEETPAENELVDIKEPKSKPANLREVVFVTSEAAPWSKTGGLGDVCGSLPGALAARGHRVMVVVPRYQDYDGVTYTGMTIKVHESDIGLYYIKKDGVDWVFLDHPSYKRLGGIYGDKLGDYGDNQWRYMLLCLAALEVPLQLQLDGSVYGQNCTFVCNDWQAGLVPVYLAAKYRPGGCYQGARTVLAIHNLRYQGVFPPSTFEMLRLPSQWYGALDWQYPPHERQGAYEEEGHCVNTLKAAIGTADRLVTVSPGYAGEIQTALGGCKMEGLLQARSYALNGVLNGIDMDEWDPAQDKHIAMNYSLNNFREGKRANKEALQRQLGLPQNGDIPMVVFIGRLDYQKGADLVLSAAPSIMHDGAQMVLLGSGSEDLENGLRWLESSFPNSARCWVGFNVPLSHLMTAGADMLLMPSRFEPCGLNQLYAMRYGTIPVAYSTGGLKDTVIPFNPWTMEGTGWTFSGDCSADGLVSATKQALETFRAHRQSFEHVQVEGMKRNSSWDDAAAQYEQIFDWANHDQPFAC